MERDDLYVDESYARGAHHNDEQGKQIRKKILKVTVLLTVVTIIEVAIGATIPRASGTGTWTIVKWLFIGLTLLKAAYIVLVFMHLGDERKSLKYTILIPYIFFICYLIFIALTESTYINDLFYGE
ncbi:MAG: cytochrome C oxidase subunit IV family protein [Flavobacteriales bacterium]|nr:cytochrome C oxidase subunit IV family protein [Flavobacteriales bacterium]